MRETVVDRKKRLSKSHEVIASGEKMKSRERAIRRIKREAISRSNREKQGQG